VVRKFLYFMAIVIVFVIACGFALRIYADDLTNWALVPTAKFEQQAALKKSIYDDQDMWFSRSSSGANNPTLWRPNGVDLPEIQGKAAIFFVHPTSYIAKDRWNAPLNDVESQERARIFLRGLSTAFADAGTIWAPRYRQAAIGAFLTDKAEGKQALEAAYQDVLLAFDAFLAAQKPNTPIILAAHSQGSLHLTHLLRERIAGKPLAKRIVAAYAVGWPISIQNDLPKMGLPACTGPAISGCIMSWQSFAEPADYERIKKAYDSTIGFNGESRAGTQILCTNPLSGGETPTMPADANIGTLKPNGDLSAGALVKGAIPARCDENGFLLIGEPPNMGPYRLPGNNYHVYDYPLFWANIRADALARLKNFRVR
jgi:Protein of unknown function (DUF3089)